jgi:hypothetical protein
MTPETRTENVQPRFDYSAEHLRKADETLTEWVLRLAALE